MKRQCGRRISLLLAASMLLGMAGAVFAAEEPPPGEAETLGLTQEEGEPLWSVRQVEPPAAELFAPVGTPLRSLGLPGELYCTLEDGSERSVPVTWRARPPYDPQVAADYAFTPELPEGGQFLPGAAPTVMVYTLPAEDPPEADEPPPEESSSADAPPASVPKEPSVGDSEQEDTSTVSSQEPEEDNPSSAPEKEVAAAGKTVRVRLAQAALAALPVVPGGTLPVAPPGTLRVEQADAVAYQALPAPEVWACPDGGSAVYLPPGTPGLTWYYEPVAPTVGASSASPPTAPGAYRVVAQYEAGPGSPVFTGSDTFVIYGAAGGTLPPGTALSFGGVSEGDQWALRQRLERISGFSGVSSRRISYFDLTLRDTATGAPVTLTSPIRVTLPYPAGTDRRRHDFALVHLRGGWVEQMGLEESYYGLTFWTDSLSPFALAWRVTATDLWDGDGEDWDSEEYSAYKEGEIEFWSSVRRKIERADDGDLIRVRARGYDKMPETVMRALRRQDGVSLHISWNGGDDILIPAGEAQTPDGLRIFWPLRLLSRIYDGASLAPEDPKAPQRTPSASSAAPPSGAAKPPAKTGGVTRVDAPGTPQAETPAQTPEQAGKAPTVEQARDARERPPVKAVVTGGQTPVREEPEESAPEWVALTVAALAVLALFGVLVGAWLFSKRSKLRR